MILIGTFKSLAVFMAEYLRLEKAKPAEAAAEWTKIHSFYFDLPKKEEFKNVEKRHFYEVPFSQVSHTLTLKAVLYHEFSINISM